MGVVEDKGCRKDKAFLTLWHPCLEWRFFFVIMRGTQPVEEGTRLFFLIYELLVQD